MVVSKSKKQGRLLPGQKDDLLYIRENKRARRVTIKVQPTSRVVVTVPTGFDRSKLPDILARYSGWINGQKKRFRVRKPTMISLKAIDEKWNVTYVDEPGARTSIEELPGSILEIRGPLDDVRGWVVALNYWLHGKAHKVLKEWLDQLSIDLSIDFNRLIVKRQKTRWGSCSTKRNINLNRNLLFLGPKLARCVLLHELCHIKQPNHSEQFWELLDNYVKNSKSMDARIRKAGGTVPNWART